MWLYSDLLSIFWYCIFLKRSQKINGVFLVAGDNVDSVGAHALSCFCVFNQRTLQRIQSYEKRRDTISFNFFSKANNMNQRFYFLILTAAYWPKVQIISHHCVNRYYQCFNVVFVFIMRFFSVKEHSVNSLYFWFDFFALFKSVENVVSHKKNSLF